MNKVDMNVLTIPCVGDGSETEAMQDLTLGAMQAPGAIKGGNMDGKISGGSGKRIAGTFRRKDRNRKGELNQGETVPIGKKRVMEEVELECESEYKKGKIMVLEKVSWVKNDAGLNEQPCENQ